MKPVKIEASTRGETPVDEIDELDPNHKILVLRAKIYRKAHPTGPLPESFRTVGMKPPRDSEEGHLTTNAPLSEYQTARNTVCFAGIKKGEQATSSAYQIPEKRVEIATTSQQPMFEKIRNGHSQPVVSGVGHHEFQGGRHSQAPLHRANSHGIHQRQRRSGCQYSNGSNQVDHEFGSPSTSAGFALYGSNVYAQQPPASFIPCSPSRVTQQNSFNGGPPPGHHTQTQPFHIPAGRSHRQVALAYRAPVHPASYNTYATLPVASDIQRPMNTNQYLGVTVSLRDNVPFRPSRKLLNTEPARSLEIEQALMHMGFNPNYKGDVKLEELYIPNEENCCLYLKGIPQRATRKQIFDQLCMGGIYTFKLDPSVPGRYDTCAAKVAYTTRAAAERLLDYAGNVGLSICGYNINVSWNRNKTRELKGLEARQSRVIQVRGPKKMSASKLLDLFHAKIDFTLVDYDEWLTPNGSHKVVEIHFESILGQSRAAMKCFAQKASSAKDGSEYSVSYAADPCEKAFQNRQSRTGWGHPCTP